MDDPTKVVTRRVFGYLINSIIMTLIAAGLYFAFASQYDKETSTGGDFTLGDTRFGFSGGDELLWTGACAIIYLIVFVIIAGRTGRTPGNLLTGTKIIKTATGGIPGIWRQFLRQILWVVDGLPGGVPLVAFISASASKHHRRVGDMVAKTYVIRSNAEYPVSDRQSDRSASTSSAPPSSPNADSSE